MADLARAASPIARTAATAGALSAGAGILLLPWHSLGLTQWLATLFVASTGLLLHVRHVGAQLASRSLWLASGMLGLLNLVLGPARQSMASALIAGGATTALLALGRSGLGPGEARGPFVPEKFRIPLLFSLALATADAAGFAFYGVVLVEAWGLWTSNLIFAAALTTGAFGLVRMRTWGLMLLAATHAAIFTVALGGGLRVPLVVAAIYGVSSLAALVGLSPMLALAAKKLFSEESAEPARVRIATPAGARIDDLDATAEGEAAAEVEARTIATPRKRSTA
jgi:hypothetical protein